MGKFLSKPIKSTPSSYTRVLEPPITEIAQEAEDRIKKQNYAHNMQKQDYKMQKDENN